MNSFQATVASRGYHVYKNTTWTNARLGEKVLIALETLQSSLEVDPYACAVKIKNRFYEHHITVGHLPREISRHIHFFIKTEGGKVQGTVKSLLYRASPIPAGGLEIPLILKFENKDQETLDIMHGFVKSLYDWNYDGQAKKGESNEVESDNEDDTDFSVTIEGNKIDVSEDKIDVSEDKMDVSEDKIDVCESNMEAIDENNDNQASKTVIVLD